jgi:hypothetical protein
MKHQYEDYIKFVDGEIAKRKRIFEGLVRPIPDQLNSYHDVGIASLLANKATLERHKPIQILGGSKHDGGITHRCGECKGIFGTPKVAPCPSLRDVTNQLNEVME